MQFTDFGISYPKGFEVASAAAGLKEGRDDMALIYSASPAQAALSTTTNHVKAAPVIWDQEIMLKTPIKQAVLINAGNANCCTGEKGYEDSVASAKAVAEELKLQADEVFVCSTGVIGVKLPMEKIFSGIDALCKNLETGEEASLRAAKAIMTTDTKVKSVSMKIDTPKGEIRFGAMCKGSGMIRPGMATMLSFTSCDADIKAPLLKKIHQKVVDQTYNMISVDGDMSTNDTALILANGQSGIAVTEDDEALLKQVYEALLNLHIALARAIAKDGEGATKLLTVHVKGAETEEDCRVLAKSVINSPLVKTAMFGSDANWGRILCALGYAGVPFEPEQAKLVIESGKGQMLLFEDGSPVPFSEEIAKEILLEDEIIIRVDAGQKNTKATAWGCDLSYDYVKINGDYRS